MTGLLLRHIVSTVTVRVWHKGWIINAFYKKCKCSKECRWLAQTCNHEIVMRFFLTRTYLSFMKVVFACYFNNLSVLRTVYINKLWFLSEPYYSSIETMRKLSKCLYPVHGLRTSINRKEIDTEMCLRRSRCNHVNWRSWNQSFSKVFARALDHIIVYQEKQTLDNASWKSERISFLLPFQGGSLFNADCVQDYITQYSRSHSRSKSC